MLLDRQKAARFPGRAQVITDLMGLCGRHDIDLVVLNGASPLVQHRVLRDGHVLFALDSPTLAEFTIRAFQEYVDTRPLRKLQAEQLRRWLAREAQRLKLPELVSPPFMAQRLDGEVVRRRLQYLAEAVQTLRRLQGLGLDELKRNRTSYGSVAYGLQTCIQAVLHIADHLARALGGRVGEGYREPLLRLAEQGVLPGEFARRIAWVTRLRDVLVDSLGVEADEIHRVLTENLDDFVAFAAYVEQFLERCEPQTRTQQSINPSTMEAT